MKIGVISDTHNYLDPGIAMAFEGVDHILHGGDIGLPWVIMELESIAPVTAVLGNNDAGLDFKETEIIKLSDTRFLVQHIVNISSPGDPVHAQIQKAKPDVVIFGHSHKAFSEMREGVLFLNPGYAGKPRFNLSRSVAILEGSPGRLSIQFKAL